jgi:hypothetical protein
MAIGALIVLALGLVSLLVIVGAWRKMLRLKTQRGRGWLLAGCLVLGIVAGSVAVRLKRTSDTGDTFGFPLPWGAWEWNWKHTRKIDFVSPLSPVIAGWDFLLCVAVFHVPAWIVVFANRRRAKGERGGPG